MKIAKCTQYVLLLNRAARSLFEAATLLAGRSYVEPEIDSDFVCRVMSTDPSAAAIVRVSVR